MVKSILEFMIKSNAESNPDHKSESKSESKFDSDSDFDSEPNIEVILTVQVLSDVQRHEKLLVELNKPSFEQIEHLLITH